MCPAHDGLCDATTKKLVSYKNPTSSAPACLTRMKCLVTNSFIMNIKRVEDQLFNRVEFMFILFCAPTKSRKNSKFNARPIRRAATNTNRNRSNVTWAFVGVRDNIREEQVKFGKEKRWERMRLACRNIRVHQLTPRDACACACTCVYTEQVNLQIARFWLDVVLTKFIEIWYNRERKFRVSQKETLVLKFLYKNWDLIVYHPPTY